MVPYPTKKFLTFYTRRFLGARQPLCGNGVTSRNTETVMPAD